MSWSFSHNAVNLPILPTFISDGALLPGFTFFCFLSSDIIPLILGFPLFLTLFAFVHCSFSLGTRRDTLLYILGGDRPHQNISAVIQSPSNQNRQSVANRFTDTVSLGESTTVFVSWLVIPVLANRFPSAPRRQDQTCNHSNEFHILDLSQFSIRQDIHASATGFGLPSTD
jgi:hypothetical protein